jgi:adenylate cyclase
MEGLSADEVVARAGVTPQFLDELVQRAIVSPSGDGTFTTGAVRAITVISDLERAGLPIDGIAEAVRGGHLSFEFFDSGQYDRIATLTSETFREASERLDIPLQLLLVVREAIGFAVADPDERMREDEVDILPLVTSALRGGLPPDAIERLLRVAGESMRRIAETESEAWLTHLVRPFIASGMPPQQVFEMAARFGEAALGDLERGLTAIHRGQQGHVWMDGMYEWVEEVLDRAGLRSKVTRPPAVCFFDLSGYTRLTEERGDAAAAGMALTLSGLVQRTAHEHEGRVVKWLGDGVMVYFAHPTHAIVGALEMAERVPAAGLPNAHVGVDAGPVIIQDGDFFGTTVNLASRIAAYARAGEVLATDRAVAAAELPPGIRWAELGDVELKGVSRPVSLVRIERAP